MIAERLEFQLKEILGNDLKVNRMVPLFGGDINEAFRIECDDRDLCIKINRSKGLDDLFIKEAEGLKLLSKSDFVIPEVIDTGSVGTVHYLLLEYIAKGEPKEDFWEDFGRKLAHMHMISSDTFGCESDNYIATLRQSNTRNSSWSDFYFQERLLPLIEMAIQKERLTTRDRDEAEKFYKILPELFPSEAPALLHGDLWSGNFMINNTGDPVLIDPAAYFGHREIDLAMTKLFGGFNDRLYEAYNEAYPLESGWKDRLSAGKLYPLLVHVNLFGGHYSDQYRSNMRKYI